MQHLVRHGVGDGDAGELDLRGGQRNGGDGVVDQRVFRAAGEGPEAHAGVAIAEDVLFQHGVARVPGDAGGAVLDEIPGHAALAGAEGDADGVSAVDAVVADVGELAAADGQRGRADHRGLLRAELVFHDGGRVAIGDAQAAERGEAVADHVAAFVRFRAGVVDAGDADVEVVELGVLQIHHRARDGGEFGGWRVLLAGRNGRDDGDVASAVGKIGTTNQEQRSAALEFEAALGGVLGDQAEFHPVGEAGRVHFDAAVGLDETIDGERARAEAGLEGEVGIRIQQQLFAGGLVDVVAVEEHGVARGDDGVVVRSGDRAAVPGGGLAPAPAAEAVGVDFLGRQRAGKTECEGLKTANNSVPRVVGLRQHGTGSFTSG